MARLLPSDSGDEAGTPWPPAQIAGKEWWAWGCPDMRDAGHNYTVCRLCTRRRINLVERHGLRTPPPERIDQDGRTIGLDGFDAAMRYSGIDPMVQEGETDPLNGRIIRTDLG